MPSDGSMAADGAAPAAEARIIGVLNGGINGVPAFLRAALRAEVVEARGAVVEGHAANGAVRLSDAHDQLLRRRRGFCSGVLLGLLRAHVHAVLGDVAQNALSEIFFSAQRPVPPPRHDDVR